jgi:hypothetical protein
MAQQQLIDTLQVFLKRVDSIEKAVWNGSNIHRGVTDGTLHGTVSYNKDQLARMQLMKFDKTPIQHLIKSLTTTVPDYTISDNTNKLLNQLSAIYGVLYISNEESKLYLYKGKMVNEMPKFPLNIVGQPVNLHCSYAKYNCCYNDIDFRSTILSLPKINALYYNCGCVANCSCEYINLPRVCQGSFTIFNNSEENSIVIKNSRMLAEYCAITPCYLFQHKYIKVLCNAPYFKILYMEYLNDNYSGTEANVKHCYTIINNLLYIRYGIVEGYYPLYYSIGKRVAELFKGINYTPSSITNIPGELEELRTLLQTDKKITLQFEY